MNQPIQWILTLRNRYVLVLDLVLLSFVPFASLALRLDGFDLIFVYQTPLVVYTFLSVVIKVATFYRAGLYARYWRYASVDELFVISRAVFGSSLVITFVYYVLIMRVLAPWLTFPHSVAALDFFLALLVVGGPRFFVRLVERYRYQRLGLQGEHRVLVIGAGDAGRIIVREMQSNPQLGFVPVGFIDDDPLKRGMWIQSVQVLGDSQKLVKLAQAYKVEQAVIAMPTAPGKTIRELVRICEQADLAVRTVPGIYEILNNRVIVSQIRHVQIEDLLRREPVQIDASAVRQCVQGKRVLVTGAGGSIGSELCRQIAQYAPAQLVLLGHGEHSIFMLAAELARTAPRLPLARVIADVRDAERIRNVFAQHQPQIIFHAAAHKHVPLMEENVADAVTNNVLGTRVVVDAASQMGVQNFVLISTDKAVNPTSVMGVCKRVAELIVCDAARRNGRCYVSVRFGNVLGSRGSVVNVFREQLARGGPLTITDPEMRRYFMTIPEATQLVLQSMTLGKGGEIFVLDMGEPVKIADMARDLVELSGLQLGRDVDIVYTGVRPGEKLFEELFLANDHYERTEHEKVFVSRNGQAHEPRTSVLAQQVDSLLRAARQGERVAIEQALKHIVPEYKPVAISAPITEQPIPASARLAVESARADAHTD